MTNRIPADRRRAVNFAILAIMIMAAWPAVAAFGVEPVRNVRPVPPQKPSDDSFARALYAQLSGKPGNVVVSPASVESCVLLALAGARGQTAEQIVGALKLPPGSAGNMNALLNQWEARLGLQPAAKGPASSLVVANSVWVQSGFPVLDSYRKLLTTNRRATFEQVDFASHTEAARQKINAWVSDKTARKIPELFASGIIQPEARMVLANAIYFKQNWDSPFNLNATKDEPFHRPGMADIRVPMMRGGGDRKYLETDSYQVLELPYAGNRESMIIWLPKQADKIDEMEKQLASTSLSKTLSALREFDVHFALPRFKISSDLMLRQPLEDLGMREAFQDSADFSGISSQGLKISTVVHKALVEVDEKGTEAAAATGAVAVPTAAPFDPTPPKEFRADHPFVFAICIRATSEILFLGRVVEPNS